MAQRSRSGAPPAAQLAAKPASKDPNDPIVRLQTGKIPKEWKKVLKAAGVTKKDLCNEETAKLVYKLIIDHLRKANGGGAEMSMIAAKATVYHFDAQSEAWKQVDTGLSKVEIFNDPNKNTYRVVAVSYQSEQIVIDSQIFKNTNYTQASATFHQWADSAHMYGLNFASAKDAEAFSRTFAAVLRMLAKLSDQSSVTSKPVP